ncbi:mitochondrial peptidyl-tRNA hydrolase [Xylaria cf. heliscus]|nr:mitochondrial peptidyl-tRNA hydrolase [Xylaria cf. heliscus]
MLSRRFLVISLGNQTPYYNCMHSIGHFALDGTQKALAPSQPFFDPTRLGQKSCNVSSAVPYTLAKSPTMMNNCGPWVLAAYRESLEQYSLQPSELALVLVHDVLDAGFGEVKLRRWDSSTQGHNGVRSVKASTDSLRFPKDHWARIVVGIGRPKERAAEVVSEYVLRKIPPHTIAAIHTRVAPKVVDYLRQLQDEWARGDDGT